MTIDLQTLDDVTLRKAHAKAHEFSFAALFPDAILNSEQVDASHVDIVREMRRRNMSHPLITTMDVRYASVLDDQELLSYHTALKSEQDRTSISVTGAQIRSRGLLPSAYYRTFVEPAPVDDLNTVMYEKAVVEPAITGIPVILTRYARQYAGYVGSTDTMINRTDELLTCMKQLAPTTDADFVVHGVFQVRSNGEVDVEATRAYLLELADGVDVSNQTLYLSDILYFDGDVSVKNVEERRSLLAQSFVVSESVKLVPTFVVDNDIAIFNSVVEDVLALSDASSVVIRDQISHNAPIVFPATGIRKQEATFRIDSSRSLVPTTGKLILDPAYVNTDALVEVLSTKIAEKMHADKAARIAEKLEARKSQDTETIPENSEEQSVETTANVS